MNCFIKSCPIQIIVDSRGDRYLSHSSRHTQAPVPATISEEDITEGRFFCYMGNATSQRVMTLCEVSYFG